MDPWEAYKQEFTDRGLKGPPESDQARFDEGVEMLCPGGREVLANVKNLASNPPGSPDPALANLTAAVGAGAMWEHGCGQGEDIDLYTPIPLPAAPATAPWPCEPGYPNCTKEQSERYLETLEWCENEGKDLPGMCGNPPAAEPGSPPVTDVNGETYEEWCRRNCYGPGPSCPAG